MKSHIAIASALLAAGSLAAVPAPQQQEASPGTTYHATFTLVETLAGKPTTRTYVMTLRNSRGASDEINVGGRIPIRTDGEKYSYSNTGLDLSCQVMDVSPEPARSIPVRVHVNITSVAPGSLPNLPILRTADSTVNSDIQVGRKTQLTSLEDLNSDAHYELSVQIDRDSN